MGANSCDDLLDRGEFLKTLALLAGGTALFPLINHNQAGAEPAPQEDSSLHTESVEYPGKTGAIRASLTRPKGDAKSPGVIVIHENRGLNPHIEDVTRRVAAEGFLAMAPDALHSPDLQAAVPYYGRQPATEEVPKIKASLLLHYAGLDERINKGIPEFEAALKEASVEYRLHMYEGAKHAFNNDTNPGRYHKEAAQLAWKRTIAFLKEKLEA